MSIDTKDILLKAAEDVQSGMWCKVETFDFAGGGRVATDLLLPLDEDALTLEEAMTAKRCAVGSIAVATASLGGDWHDHGAARAAVEARLDCSHSDLSILGVMHFNDSHLPDDPFEAGQQLAELFRSTAEAL